MSDITDKLASILSPNSNDTTKQPNNSAADDLAKILTSQTENFNDNGIQSILTSSTQQRGIDSQINQSSNTENKPE